MSGVTLTEFLLARIAEDEEAARACALTYPTPWEVVDRGHMAKVQADAPFFLSVVELDQDAEPNAEWLSDRIAHVSRWDPARVLAECEAKLLIVREHPRHGWLPEGRDECAQCGCADDNAVDWPCLTLKALTLPYADHPDYREEWRP